MPYGSIVSGLVNAGFDIYNQLSKPNPQAQFAQESSRINAAANKYLAPFTNPKYWSINPQDLAAQSIQFGLQVAPNINQANMNQLQGLLNQAFPGYQTMFNQATANAQRLMSGQVPTDVQQQIQRNAAFTSLVGGTAGAGTGTTGAITARDLGLTSLQLQGQGTQQFQGLMQTASNYMMPQLVNPLSILPLSSLINTQEWSLGSAFQANQAMFTAKSNAAAAQAGMPGTSTAAGIGSGISSGISALTQSPGGQSGGSGSIMSLISGLFGGSGGGGMSGLGSGAYSGGGGATVGSYTGGTSDFSSLFGNAMGV